MKTSKKANALQTPAARQRRRAFEAMPRPLQRVAEKMDEKAGIVSRGALLVAYDMGKMVREVVEGAEYGSQAVGQLAVYLGVTETALYDLRTLAETYTWEKLEDLSKKKMANGRHISKEHCLAVMRIKSESDRQKMWKRIFNEGLSVQQTQTEIAAIFEMANKRYGGRRPATPSSPVAGAQEISKMVQRINRKFEVWDQAVFSAADLQAGDGDGVTEVLYNKLREAENELEKAEDNLMTYRPKLQKTIDRIGDLLKEATRAEGEKKAPKKKSTKKKSKAAGKSGFAVSGVNTAKKKSPKGKTAKKKSPPRRKVTRKKTETGKGAGKKTAKRKTAKKKNSPGNGRGKK